MSATPTWAARVEAYLAYRRSLGFELSIEGGQLGSFARFADQRGAERLTLELATTLPALLSSLTVTPEMPASPESCTPFMLASSHTLSPMEAFW